MSVFGHCPSVTGLDRHGIVGAAEVHWNLSPAELYEGAIRQGEGRVAGCGALVCSTGEHTGRSPQDKFIVDEPQTHDEISWGPVNKPISEEHFDALHRHVAAHFKGRRLYVRDMFAAADGASQVPIRVVNEAAWHHLFATQLFLRPKPGSTRNHVPKFTILHAPTCKADPKLHGTRTETFIALHLSRGLALIGGTHYAGEIKKCVFTVMNFVLPRAGVLSMHCSANVGERGDVALFFGLSGTGKTTLSADPQRRLIGDDEHGWSDSGVFNVEGGCYAKCIKLSRESEPQIFNAIRFGAVLENVVMDPLTRELDYHSDELTENTRAAYPIEHIDNALIPSLGGHPRNVVFLTCDAFGVLPPVARLTPDQAMYHFLSGYTAKVAGTERGVTGPQATFSTCFGAPFLPLPPERYATMLGERLTRSKAACWLINTGWTGGGLGTGQRISLRHTRSIVRAALSGALDNVAFVEDPVFGVSVPRTCPDVPPELLSPRSSWRDKDAYDAKARELAQLFRKNFQAFPHAPASVAAAGPKA